jgi:hypothetical protein
VKYSPEFKMLLKAAQPSTKAECLRDLADAGIDWQALLDLATWHRLRPIVYDNLQRTCWDIVPLEAQRKWQNYAKALLQHSLQVYGRLVGITAAFDTEQIPVVALKGPALSHALYCDIALREFDDLDLLVREADFVRAVALLKQIGYNSNWQVDPRTQVEFLRYHGESALSSVQGGVPIDLHWRLAAENNALPLEAAFLWPRFRPVEVDRRTLLGFAPEDLVLYLASQGGHDEWRDLRRICEISAVIATHPRLNWDPIIQLASNLHGLRVVLLGLALGEELCGANLPDVVKAKIRADSRIFALKENILASLETRSRGGDVQRSLFQIRVKESTYGKIRLGWIILTCRTECDGRWVLLPKAFWPLYRVLRPLRQLIKVVSGWAQQTQQ